MMRSLSYWLQPDGTYSLVAPITNDEKEITPCYSRTMQGEWYYSHSAQSSVNWINDILKLPKEIQLTIFLTGED